MCISYLKPENTATYPKEDTFVGCIPNLKPEDTVTYTNHDIFEVHIFCQRPEGLQDVFPN